MQPRFRRIEKYSVRSRRTALPPFEQAQRQRQQRQALIKPAAQDLIAAFAVRHAPTSRCRTVRDSIAPSPAIPKENYARSGTGCVFPAVYARSGHASCSRYAQTPMRTHGRFAYSQKRREADAAVRDLGADAAAVGLGGRSGNGQADARAADGAGMRLVRAVKPVEEPEMSRLSAPEQVLNTCICALFPALETRSEILPPSSEYLTALSSRMETICCTACRSPVREDAVLDLL